MLHHRNHRKSPLKNRNLPIKKTARSHWPRCFDFTSFCVRTDERTTCADTISPNSFICMASNFIIGSGWHQPPGSRSVPQTHLHFLLCAIREQTFHHTHRTEETARITGHVTQDVEYSYQRFTISRLWHTPFKLCDFSGIRKQSGEKMAWHALLPII